MPILKCVSCKLHSRHYVCERPLQVGTERNTCENRDRLEGKRIGINCVKRDQVTGNLLAGRISACLRHCKSVDAASGAMAALAYLASTTYPPPLLFVPSSRSSGQPDEPVARSHPVSCRFHDDRAWFIAVVQFEITPPSRHSEFVYKTSEAPFSILRFLFYLFRGRSCCCASSSGIVNHRGVYLLPLYVYCRDLCTR